ncbi:hypothetical protein BJ170DRAFT_335568 [Xylariales sp. AK1849]|nr:hypothetical protein BJ170DRAFT_335568 [Xylariales sp. AK1849]
MSSLKQRISSPLEAGISILDSQNLPPHLTQALEYASKRLSRKALHITLLVVRKEYQLPSSTLPYATSPSSSASTPASPEFITSGALSPSRFASPVAGLRQLVRRGTNTSIASTTSTISETSSRTTSRSAATSPTFPPPPSEPLSTHRRWPPTPGSPPPYTPCTPHTPSSTTTGTSTTSTASAGGPNPFGIRLIYTTPLSPRAERTLRTTITKAERKFRTGTGFLPPAVSASALGLNNCLIRRSILQNEVLFSSEGLTLLGLDRLYTFKSALAAYARTTLPKESLGSPIVDGCNSARVEDAVDELRRLVLANGGRRVLKGDLHRTYEWIGVSAGALGDVERMYRRAYGGWERAGAFEEPVVEVQERDFSLRPAPSPRNAGVVKIGTPPGLKGPVLKLQTKFETPAIQKPSVIRPVPVKASSSKVDDAGQAHTAMAEVVELAIKIDGLDDEDNDGDLTARPAAPGQPFWNVLGPSIDEMLQQQQEEESASPVLSRDNLRVSRMSQMSRKAPMTPNGYDDISPITRGEWGFLFSGDGWKAGRTAAVETCQILCT